MLHGTIITKKIDNIDIVIGFDTPVIEPKETRKVVDTLLLDTDEFKAITTKQQEMEVVKTIGNEAFRAAGKAAIKNIPSSTEAIKQWAIYEQESIKFKQLMVEMVTLRPALKNIHRKLIKDNAVYFHPKGTEIIKTTAEINLLKNKVIPQGHLLDIDGNIIINNRGKKYWEKISGTWKETAINKIDVNIPSSGKVISDLSKSERKEIDKQVKVEMIATLSSPDKLKYKEAEITYAAAAAAGMRSQLEIQNDPDPFGKAQAEYNKELAEINLMYG